jgi:hypothetical protein
MPTSPKKSGKTADGWLGSFITALCTTVSKSKDASVSDPFATTTGRVAVVLIAVVGGAVGGGYVTSDGLEERLEQARLEGRVAAIEEIIGGLSGRVRTNERDIGTLTRTVDQHGNRINTLERRGP